MTSESPTTSKLSPQELDDLKKIIRSLYGKMPFDPHLDVVALNKTEFAMNEFLRCDGVMKKFGNSLGCMVTGKGWLRRCLKAARRASESHGDLSSIGGGCWASQKAAHKSAILGN